MEEIKVFFGEMNKEQENTKEQFYHINNKEEILANPATSSTMIEQEIEQHVQLKLQGTSEELKLNHRKAIGQWKKMTRACYRKTVSY